MSQSVRHSVSQRRARAAAPARRRSTNTRATPHSHRQSHDMGPGERARRTPPGRFACSRRRRLTSFLFRAQAGGVTAPSGRSNGPLGVVVVWRNNYSVSMGRCRCASPLPTRVSCVANSGMTPASFFERGFLIGTIGEKMLDSVPSPTSLPPHAASPWAAWWYASPSGGGTRGAKLTSFASPEYEINRYKPPGGSPADGLGAVGKIKGIVYPIIPTLFDDEKPRPLFSDAEALYKPDHPMAALMPGSQTNRLSKYLLTPGEPQRAPSVGPSEVPPDPWKLPDPPHYHGPKDGGLLHLKNPATPAWPFKYPGKEENWGATETLWQQSGPAAGTTPGSADVSSPAAAVGSQSASPPSAASLAPSP